MSSFRARTRRLYLLLLSIVALIPLLPYAYLPLTDAPNHLLAAFIIVHYRDPHFRFPTYFTYDLTPRSNILGHYLMILLLRAGLSPQNTLRVFAGIIVLTTLGGLYLLLRVTRGPDHAAFWLPLGIPLAYTWFFHQGFLNFSFSVGLGLLTLALGLGLRIWGGNVGAGRPLRTWAMPYLFLTGALYATYLAHALGLALVLTAVGGLLLAQSLPLLRKKHIRHLTLLLARGLLPFLLLALLIYLTGKLSPNAGGESQAFLSPPFIVWVPLSKKVAELRYGLLNYTPWREQLILLPLALLYLVYWLRTWRRPRPWHLPPLLALAAYFLLPMGFWVPFFIYERFWLFALLLGIVVLPLPERTHRVRYWGTRGLLLLMPLLFLLNLTNDYRIANGYLRDYDRVLEELPPRAVAFPFTYHHQGRISPARHFWAYAMMRQDVFIPMVFAETYHPVQYRPSVPRPYPLHYEDGFFAEHARNRATLWVRVDDPLMQERTLPKLPRHGYVQTGRIGPYAIYRLSTWPPPVPPEARPHIRPEIVRTYTHLLLFGYPPAHLVEEIERSYHLAVQWGLAKLYRRGEP
ncbi:MAG: hypothetical protein GXO55_02730 [Chloroflexi bacterium]|nr:hypothetical protein [Chloroflexota bacterium]